MGETKPVLSTRGSVLFGDKESLIAATALLCVYALLVLATFRDYGMSWDQPSSHSYGQAVVSFYTTFGHDATATKHWLRPYGGLYEIAAAVLERTTGLGWLEARNLTSGIFGLFGAVAIVKTSRLLAGGAAGVFASILVLVTPAYYGHQFINPKDLPFAAATAWALYFTAKYVMEFPTPTWRTSVFTGFGIGCALAIRVGGLQLFSVLGAGVVLAVIRLRALPGPSPVNWWKVGPHFVVVFVLAWLVMVALWPFAFSAPISGPFAALKEFSKFWWDGNVFYNGRSLKASELPLTYIPNLLVRTLPEIHLLGITLLAVGLIRRRGRLDVSRWEPQFIGLLTIVIGVAAPVAAIWVLRANLYDGLRHVLFIWPPIVVLAAVGLAGIDREAWTTGVRNALLALVVTLGVLAAFDMRRIHPYQYLYFNRAIGGGLETAYRYYDLDYWATALKEAVEWAQFNYQVPPGTVVLYSASAEPEQSAYFVRKEAGLTPLERAENSSKAKLHFVIRRGRQITDVGWGRTIHQIKRDGVVLVDIVEVP